MEDIMFRLDRLGLLVLICLVSGITLSLFFEAVRVQAKQPINPNSLLLTPTAEPSSPGQPCGSGTTSPRYHLSVRCNQSTICFWRHYATQRGIGNDYFGKPICYWYYIRASRIYYIYLAIRN